MKKLSLAVLLILLTWVLLTPNGVNAAFLGFDDTSANDTITVSANDFEGGLSINGALFQQGLNNPATGTFAEANGPISFSGRWLDNGQTQPGPHTIYLVEASDPTLISDILQYTLDSASGFGFINGTFTSDFENNLGLLPAGVDPASVFIENGQPVPFGAPFLQGQVLSDAEVPEPGAASILLLGLLGAGALNYARLRKQAE